MEEFIKTVDTQTYDENLIREMGNKIKSYRIKDAFVANALQIQLPQFFLNIPSNSLGVFDTNNKTKLSREPLLENFKLSQEDIRINFKDLGSDLYKVDLDKNNKYRPTISQIEDSKFKNPLISFILKSPKEKQILDVSNLFMNKIGNMFPIADYEIQKYINRILEEFDTEKIKDAIVRPTLYTKRIKNKIRSLADVHAETKFNDLVKINKIFTEPSWSLKETIVPGKLGNSISKSLYEREGIMNSFEEQTILKISSFKNIIFWHRNLGKRKRVCN